MTGRVVVVEAGSDVEAWSSVRLPFEPQGWLAEFRGELAAACRTLVARPNQVLHATYSAEDRRLVDVENVLTYNLGTGAILATARHGLMLERAFEKTGPRIDDAHHYRYHLVDRRCGWAHWRSGELLGTVRLHGSADLFASPRAARWWLAARRGQVIMHRRAATVPDLFGLKVVVTPPEGWRGSLAGILKTLVDGLTAALHAHDPVVDPRIPDRAAKIDPALTPDDLRALLAEPVLAPLGRVRFVTPWRDVVQLSPADDRMVAFDIRLSRDRPPGTITAEAVDVGPIH